MSFPEGGANGSISAAVSGIGAGAAVPAGGLEFYNTM